MTATKVDAPLSRSVRDLPQHLKVGRYKSATFWNAHDAGFFDPEPDDLICAKAAKPIVNGFGMRYVMRDLDGYEQDLCADIKDQTRVQRAVSGKKSTTGYLSADTAIQNIRRLRAMIDVWGPECGSAVMEFVHEEHVAKFRDLIVDVSKTHREVPDPARSSPPDIVEKIEREVASVATEPPVEECEHGIPRTHTCQQCIRETEDAADLAADNLAHGDDPVWQESADAVVAAALAPQAVVPDFEPHRTVESHLYEKSLAELVAHGAAESTATPESFNSGFVGMRHHVVDNAAFHGVHTGLNQPAAVVAQATIEEASRILGEDVHAARARGDFLQLADWHSLCERLPYNLGVVVDIIAGHTSYAPLRLVDLERARLHLDREISRIGGSDV